MPPALRLHAATAPAPRRRRLLWVAVLVYVLLRALVLHTNFDAVSVPVYELHGKGSLAKAVSLGVGVPLADYYDNCGGKYVTGLLAAPLFRVLDDSYWTLKLVGVGLGLATLLLIWWLLDRHFGRAAADVAALLFALGPPTLTKFSMIAMGNHFESLLFQLGVIALALELARRRFAGRWLFATGLLAGLTVFLYFGSLVVLVILAGRHLLVRGVRRTLADLRFVVPGFLLGLLPLAWVELSTGGRVSQFLGAHGGESGGGTLGGFVQRLQLLVTEVLPRAGVYEDLGPWPGELSDALFLGVFALCWLVLLPGCVGGIARALASHRGPRAEGDDVRRAADLASLPWLFYLPLLALVWARSDFRFTYFDAPMQVAGYRYLIPHLALAVMLVGMGSGRLLDAGGARRRLGAGLAGVALLTGLSTLSLVDWSFEQAGIGRHYEGHAFERYATLFVKNRAADGAKLDTGSDAPRRADELADAATDEAAHEAVVGAPSPFDRQDVRRMLAEMPRHLALAVYASMGHYEVHRRLSPRRGAAAALDLERIVAPFAQDVRLELARGAGTGLRGLLLSGRRADVERALEVLRRLDASGHALAPFVVEGLCLDRRFTLARQAGVHLAASASLRGAIPPRLLAAHDRGLGVQCGRLLRRGIPSDVDAVGALAAGLAADASAPFWSGVGWGLGDRGAEPGPPPGWDAWLSPEVRALVLPAFGAALRHVAGPAATAPPDLSAWPPDERQLVQRGFDGPEPAR